MSFKQQDGPGLMSWAARVGPACGALAVCFGATVLSGWHFEIVALINGGSTQGCVQYNSALGFVLCGLSVCLLRSHPRSARAFGFAAVLLGGATLWQYATGVNLGIDELMMKDYVLIKTSHPGRMAPNTAVCLMLVGAASIAAAGARSGGRGIRVAAATIVLSISLLSLLGHTVSVESAFGWGNMTRMSLPSSSCFFLLGAGHLIAAVYRHVESHRMLPGWLPFPIAVCVCVGSAGLAISQRSEHEHAIRQLTLDDCVRTRIKLKVQIDAHVDSLQRLAIRSKDISLGDVGLWQRDAQMYLQHMPGVYAIAWVTADRQVGASIMSPEARSKDLPLDANMLRDHDVFERARDVKAPVFGQIERSDVAGAVLGLALFDHATFDGVLMVAFDEQKVLKNCLTNRNRPGFRHEIAKTKAGPACVVSTPGQSSRFMQEQPIHLFGQDMWLRSHPTGEIIAKLGTLLPAVTGVLGTLMAVCLGLLIGAALRLQAAAVRQNSANNQLRAEIEAREAGEKELRASEERFRRAVDESPYPTMIHGIDGRIVHLSKSWMEISGFTTEELPTVFDWVRLAVLNEPDKALSAIQRTYTMDDHVEEGEREIVTKSGNRRTWAFRSAQLGKLPDNRSLVITMATDTTERIRNLASLEKTTQSLRRSNQELERFAYVASHDLQEPLRMVASYLQLIETDCADKLGERQMQFLRFAVDGAKRMKSLILGLLEYSRLQSCELTIQPVDGEKILKDALGLLAQRIDETNAVITHDALPTIHGDATQLARLLQNLLENALTYHAPDQAPKLHVSATEEDGEWRIAVQDDGIGMDAKLTPRIFELFKRLHGRDQYPGTGIGLAACKTIVERHGGVIWVETAIGQGSTFYFTIPKAKEHYEQHVSRDQTDRDLVGGGQPG